MAASSAAPSWQRFLIVWAGLIIIVASLYFARVVLVPIVMAVLLSFILTPLVSALQRRGLGRVPSVLLVLALLIAGIAGAGALIMDQVDLDVDLRTYKNQIMDKLAGLRESTKDSVWEGLFDLGSEVVQTIQGGDQAANRQRVTVESSTMPLVGSIVGSLLEAILQVGFVLLLVAFMLINREEMRNRLYRLWGRLNLTSTTKALDEAGQRISRYLVAQLAINASYGVVISFGLLLIGVPYAAVWGIIAGALRYLPYIGPWVGAMFPLTMAFAVFPGWTPMMLVLGLILAVELFISNVVEPILYGRSIGVSEVALLIAAAFWTWLWGPWGLVLSTPMTACLAVLGRYVPHLEFLHVLLGNAAILTPPESYYQRLLARDLDEATDLVEKHLQEHPVESVYDELLAPALALVKRDRALGTLTREDEEFILGGTSELLVDLILPREQELRAETTPASDDSLPAARPLIFGFPAQDEEDELALTCLRQMLDPAKCRFEVISGKTVAGEGLARIKEDEPAFLFVGSLAVKKPARTRYLCKRFHAQFPDLKILVGCWHAKVEEVNVRSELLQAGANQIGLTLLESRNQVLAMLPLEPSDYQAMEPAFAK